MRIVFGWNRIKLKTFTFQELNLPELEQFPNAKIQVVQSYFHIFYIPTFPLGKRYDLVMNNQAYHVPPSILKTIDTEQIKVKGKWYAWSLPLIAIAVAIWVFFYGMYEDHKYRQQSMEYAEMQRDFFDHPAVGDHIHFGNDGNIEFDAEVFSFNGSRVMLFIDLLDMQDAKLIEDAENGLTKGSPDTLRSLLSDREELVNTSVFTDSLLNEYPDQPIFRRLLTFELEEFPIKYEFIELSLAEYKNLKKSIGDAYVLAPKPIKIAAFRPITKNKLFVNPQ